MEEGNVFFVGQPLRTVEAFLQGYRKVLVLGGETTAGKGAAGRRHVAGGVCGGLHLPACPARCCGAPPFSRAGCACALRGGRPLAGGGREAAAHSGVRGGRTIGDESAPPLCSPARRRAPLPHCSSSARRELGGAPWLRAGGGRGARGSQWGRCGVPLLLPPPLRCILRLTGGGGQRRSPAAIFRAAPPPRSPGAGGSGGRRKAPQRPLRRSPGPPRRRPALRAGGGGAASPPPPPAPARTAVAALRPPRETGEPIPPAAGAGPSGRGGPPGLRPGLAAPAPVVAPRLLLGRGLFANCAHFVGGRARPDRARRSSRGRCCSPRAAPRPAPPQPPLC